MAEQNYENHRHRPFLFTLATLFWLIAVVAVIMRAPSRWITMTGELATLAALGVVIWTTRAYTVRLQDRVILLEMKVRAAELLPAGEDAKLAQLTKSQIVALRFASDAELSDLLDRAVRDKLSSKEIKLAIKNWKPDLLRT
jgi:Family of unknown function (DUF6526)